MAEQPTQEQIEQIASELELGRKVEAIKIYREVTGQGLKEAKEFIEALIPKLQEMDPEKYAKVSGSEATGCASVILLCIGLTSALVWVTQYTA